MVPSHQNAASLALLLVPKEMLPAVRIRILPPRRAGGALGPELAQLLVRPLPRGISAPQPPTASTPATGGAAPLRRPALPSSKRTG